MDSYPSTPNVGGDRSPSQAQLFAEAILRRPLSQVVRPQVSATARRAELERLAPLSPRHAQELQKLRADEGEARRERELLEWSAQISTRAEKTLHAIRQAEARQRGAWRAAERFADSPLTEWNEADHPRAPKGTSIGGQWVSKVGGSIAADPQDDEESDAQRLPDELIVTAEMVRARHKREAFSDLLQAAREMGTAIVAGLGTGVKAIIAGHLGTNTAMDASTHPPAIYKLHYEFDGWPADDLITAFPCFIVSETMKSLIEHASSHFGPVNVSTSDQFEELQEFHPSRPLPKFHWLIITGVARRDDFGTTPTGGSLIVSERALQVLKAGRLDNCDIIAI